MTGSGTLRACAGSLTGPISDRGPDSVLCYVAAATQEAVDGLGRQAAVGDGFDDGGRAAHGIATGVHAL